MKILKSKIPHHELGIDIAELPIRKILIHLNDIKNEKIFAAIDEIHNKMYLLNNAVMFAPIPTWGLELPLCDKINMSTFFNINNLDQLEMTFCDKVYEMLVECNVIDTATNIVDLSCIIDNFDVSELYENISINYGDNANKCDNASISEKDAIRIPISINPKYSC